MISSIEQIYTSLFDCANVNRPEFICCYSLHLGKKQIYHFCIGKCSQYKQNDDA